MSKWFASRLVAPRGVVRVFAVAFAVALVSACGSAGPSGSGPGTVSTRMASPSSSSPVVAGVDACSLVSASDASAVIRVTLTRMADSTPNKCDYAGQDGYSAVEVTVRATTPTEFATRCATGTSFPEIGDAACGGPKVFLVRKGNTEVDFSATTSLGAGQAMMNFSYLAQKIVAKL